MTIEELEDALGKAGVTQVIGVDEATLRNQEDVAIRINNEVLVPASQVLWRKRLKRTTPRTPIEFIEPSLMLETHGVGLYGVQFNTASYYREVRNGSQSSDVTSGS